METIEHRTVSVNGINMHVAEKGSGDVVLLLHGFPELWYSWRHQILSFASHGYRAIAPDLRGYGDTDAPKDINSYTVFHIVGDLISLINSLGQDKVFVVGHDWGALVAWALCTFRPDKVRALVNLSVMYNPRNPAHRPVDFFRAVYGDDHYICRFQEPGVVEKELSSMDTALLFKIVLTNRSPQPTMMVKGLGSSDAQIALPPWLSEEDINYFASKFKKSGFSGGINYYRCMNLNWDLMGPWTGVKLNVPVKFLVGDLDLAYHIPGVKDYIHSGTCKNDLPLLQDVVVMEGVGHFINQERPDEVADHILEFIQKH